MIEAVFLTASLTAHVCSDRCEVALEPPVHHVAEVLPRPRFTGADDPEGVLTPRPRPSGAHTVTPFATAKATTPATVPARPAAPGTGAAAVRSPWTVGLHR
ncbi:MAG: hypothetical protein AAFR57_12850 [Pseudomonadota bacterium]